MPRILHRVVGVVNAVVGGLATSPRWGRVVNRRVVVITYTGRRSGRTITLPVVPLERNGDALTIGVKFPDTKKWWRNFLGAGGPLYARVDGIDRRGHAIANRDATGHVTVTVELAPA